ncbi:hypothetical protein AKJ58_00415 [candidate division MSBL1 archaeon SCGC-AAA385D11]|uniref:Zinc metalloprotease n=1 Tax=candidate division MSBL1 archaeon SCGC-AAA385D11 TaxID=1698286 RepID=A0A133VPB2_9EURY|nr:hypothetical protein AKJ58_00415 [candidate division MSBL1 archaeon SCGC-AAA385D11]
MKTSFKIGEISGIPVRLHITLLFVVGFIAWSIGSNIFQIAEIIGVDPSGISPGIESYLIGAAMAIGLFVSIFLHEMAHSLVARGMGVNIEEITLWIFGGVSNMEEIPHEPDLETKISIVGPFTSLGIGVGCYLAGIISPINSLAFVFTYLVILNVFLAAFNLIPAFPMDGGRILRATFARGESYISATEKAASIGKAFAFVMGVFGIFYNPFLILIALFVFIGASQEAQGVMVRDVLNKVKVKDIMSEDVRTVSPNMGLREFLDRVLEVQHTGFPVVENEEIVGIITMEDVKKVEQDRVDEFTVGDVMERDVFCFTPESNVNDVWQMMAKKDVGRFPVVSDRKLVGIITRSDIMRSFKALSEIERYRGGEI